MLFNKEMALKVDAEVKIHTEPSVVAWDENVLYVGTEDGSVKVSTRM